MAGMKQCPKCGWVTAPEKNYCYQDGTELVNLVKCCRCGNECGPNDKFCENCGEKVVIGEKARKK